jgi:hypothetical protein
VLNVAWSQVAARGIALGVLVIAPACQATRILRITSSPVHAEVRLDGQKVGVTPIDVPFDYYGVRRVTLYLDGYRTWSQVLPIEPPWYAYFPIDIVSEVIIPAGWTDIHEVHADLEPGTGTLLAPDLQSVLDRADSLRRAGPEGPRTPPAPAEVPKP